MSSWFVRFGFAEVADGLLVGAYPCDATDVAELARERVTRVLNLVEDAEYEPGARDAVHAALAARGIAEERASFPDYGRLAAAGLEAAVATVMAWLEDGERVYLHCRAGWQRSAAVAGGVVALRDGLAVDEALARIRARKPTAEPLGHQREDLERWLRDRSVG
jgi:protein-tyrosine phosphatase